MIGISPQSGPRPKVKVKELVLHVVGKEEHLVVFKGYDKILMQETSGAIKVETFTDKEVREYTFNAGYVSYFEKVE